MLVMVICAAMVLIVLYSLLLTRCAGLSDREAARPTVYLVPGITMADGVFEKHVKKLAGKGYHVVTCRYGASPILSRLAFHSLIECAAVVAMPSWQYHRDSRMIVAVARACGIPILSAVNLNPITSPILIVQEEGGECECEREAVLNRVGELFGAAAEKGLRQISQGQN